MVALFFIFKKLKLQHLEINNYIKMRKLHYKSFLKNLFDLSEIYVILLLC
jgi:hypothetical protein